MEKAQTDNGSKYKIEVYHRVRSWNLNEISNGKVKFVSLCTLTPCVHLHDTVPF